MNVLVLGESPAGGRVAQVIVPRTGEPDPPVRRALVWANRVTGVATHPLTFRFFAVQGEGRDARVEVERVYGVKVLG